LRKSPQAEITMRVDNTESLLQALDAGAIDFVVLEGYFRKSMYAYEVYSNERFICVCKANYRFNQEPQQLKDLFSEQLILRESGSGSREILERQLMEQNFSIQDFDRLLQIGSIHAIISLVCAGCGITFLYEAAVREELASGVLRRIELSDFQVEHPFTIVWRKNSLFDAEYRKQFSALLFE
jgi:DNA-binding transcriptional LysR family regulator